MLLVSVSYVPKSLQAVVQSKNTIVRIKCRNKQTAETILI